MLLFVLFLSIIYLLFRISICLNIFILINFFIVFAYWPKSSRALASTPALPSNAASLTRSSTMTDVIIRKQSRDKKANRKTKGKTLTAPHPRRRQDSSTSTKMKTIQNGWVSFKYQGCITPFRCMSEISFCIYQKPIVCPALLQSAIIITDNTISLIRSVY